MSADVATLVLAIDSSQVRTGEHALNSLTSTSRQTEIQTGKTAKATTMLSQAYSDLAKAAAAYKVFDFVKDSAMLAARFETMGVVMKIAGNNAGYTKVQLDAFAEGLQKSGISMLQSRNILTQLATAEIDLTKAVELGRTAQDLAVVGNINSSEALERMVHGIKSGEIEILRTLGMQVSWEKSYKLMAKEIGTTSDKLTEHQKVIARTNAVIAEGAKYNGIYEESMTTAGKAMTSLTRYWEDFKVKAGEVALPALADAVFSLTDALKAANAELETAGSRNVISDIGVGLKNAFNTVKETVLILGANVAYVFAAIGREIAAVSAQAVALANMDWSAFKGIGEALQSDNEAAEKALRAFENNVLKVGKGNASQMEESMLNARQSSKKTEEQRIAEGAATRKLRAEQDAALTSSKKTKAGKNEEQQAYESLTKAIYEKTAAAALEDDGTTKLLAGENDRAKLLYDLANGQVKLTAAHKASVLAKLEEQIAAEQQKQTAVTYGKTMKDVSDSVASAEDSTRELNAAQKILLDLMRSPEWAKMPETWQQATIEQTAFATSVMETVKWELELKALLEQTPSAQLEKQRTLMQKLAEEYQNGRFGIEGSTAAMEKYGEVVNTALGRNAEQLEKETSALDEFAKAAAQNIQKSMADFLFDPFANGTKGMLVAFGTAVRRMIADAVAADLAKRLFGDLGGKGGGGIGGLFGMLAGIFKGDSVGAQGYQLPDSGIGAPVYGGDLPSFDVGTDFVPRDMVAKVHYGEQIVPANENRKKGDTYNVSVVVPQGSPIETRRAAGAGLRDGLAAIGKAQRYA